jgi:DNA-directed RNA polymerase specialized sigma24 family protein
MPMIIEPYYSGKQPGGLLAGLALLRGKSARPKKDRIRFVKEVPPNANKTQANELLVSFLQSSSGEDTEILSLLISEHASPLIREIIRYKFHGNPSNQNDSEDLHNDIVVALLGRLHQIRAASGRNSIESFRDYVAVVSYNRCHQYFRRKYPQRNSMENRVRYLLRHDAAYALWQNGSEWICGEARFAGSTHTASSDALRRAFENQNKSKSERERIGNMFRVMQMPVKYDDLVGLFAAEASVSDYPAPFLEETVASATAEPAPFHRAYLKKAWMEICDLPLKQRIALLLSLRDEQGDGMLVAFTIVGIAGVRQIAEVMQMKAEELAEIWKDLPWDDLKIAKRSGLTRQQVINLRKCARERLGRRLSPSQKRQS